MRRDGSNIELGVPRTVQRQIMRSNIEYDSPEKYRRSIFISFLDSLLEEIRGHLRGKGKDMLKKCF